MNTTVKVLITGASGQLAQALCKNAPANMLITALTRTQLDITDASAVQLCIAELKPDVVMNTAAYTAVDKAESDIEMAYAVNVEGARNLALAVSESLAARMIHVSTDFVFDGNASRSYAADAICNPLSVYGRTKHEGERVIIETLRERAIIVRTSWLYDSHSKNFLTTMLRLMHERGMVRVVADQIGTPTSTQSLAAMLWSCVAHSELSGMYHWSDAGVASWYDFAVAIAEEAAVSGILKRDITVVPIVTSEYPTPAKRPAFSVLDKSRAYSDLKISPVHWRQKLREVLQELASA